jgi:hypothetical protein
LTSSSPKKPGVAFWATVVVVAVLVGYPLSFGPACWLTDRGVIDAAHSGRLYRPILRLCTDQSGIPRSGKLSAAVRWYGLLGVQPRLSYGSFDNDVLGTMMIGK